METIQHLLINGNITEAQLKVHESLQKTPGQLNLLLIANDVYRALGNREKSLEYAEQLIACHPDDWRGYARAAQDLAELKRFNEAKAMIENGLQIDPTHTNLLSIASNVYRSLGDREKSLECAYQLILHHPENWSGYERAAQDLVDLKRFKEAQEKVNEGLRRFPRQVNLLTTASHVYRLSGDRETSLEYAEQLIAYHQENWNGYGRAAQDLVYLKRFEEAQGKVNEGLRRFPRHLSLLTIASDVYRLSGDRETSLEYAEQLIAHHPDELGGYKRAAQGLVDLKRFKQAQKKINEGLRKFPSQQKLLTIAINAYRGTGDLEKSHEYSEELLALEPCNWKAYEQSVLNLIALKQLEIAQAKVEEGLQNCPGQVNPSIARLWINSFSSPSEIQPCCDCVNYQPFQYWSQGTPPQDVLTIQNDWNTMLASIGLSNILLFTKQTASDWIEQNVPSLLEAFRTAFHYAVEADVFRIAYALKNDCMWIDSDIPLFERHKNIIHNKLASGDSTFWFRPDRPWITNAFFATRSNSPFFEKIAGEMSHFSFAGLSPNKKLVMESFGPAKFNKTLEYLCQKPEATLGGDNLGLEASNLNLPGWRINFVNRSNFGAELKPRVLAYKSTSDHWIKAMD